MKILKFVATLILGLLGFFTGGCSVAFGPQFGGPIFVIGLLVSAVCWLLIWAMYRNQ